MTRRRIGLLGGSFNPVHVGHLALGRAAMEALKLDEIRMIPSGNSWQKAASMTPARHRLEMVRIAIAPLGPAWKVDDLEIRRGGKTYTVDTLEALRQTDEDGVGSGVGTEVGPGVGPEAALVFLIGSDQLRNLHSWDRWERILQLSHIAATQREQVPLSDLPPEVETMVREHGSDALPDRPAGSIVFFRMPAVAVSSSVIRARLMDPGSADRSSGPGIRPRGAPDRGEVLRPLLPPGVLEYIREHELFLPPTPDPSREA